ncbi:hypothetical protein HZC07_00085 [Candidatus Micrarchaeota archaeon]|nr:hypothetical protein [Candidatus Micrarchaeota archaeon]
MVEILAKHTKDPKEISYAIELMKRHGSIDYTRKISEKMINDAKNELKKLPDSKDKEALIQLADYVINRDR